MPQTKENIVSIYEKLKSQNGNTPLLYRDFLRISSIPKRQLISIFGPQPYTKLQKLAGDEPNKLSLSRTSTESIMESYGTLASEVLKEESRLPTSAHWDFKKLKPSPSGLDQSHGIKWGDFKFKFFDYCKGNKEFSMKYADVLDFIKNTDSPQPSQPSQRSALQTAVYTELSGYAPARRRNSEESYQSELANHLKSKFGDDAVREERGDSNCDIVIKNEIGIEVKKSPSLQEYDRCFGQLARHLNSYTHVFAMFFDVPRQEQYDDFCILTDKYYTDKVSVIRNG